MKYDKAGVLVCRELPYSLRSLSHLFLKQELKDPGKDNICLGIGNP